MVVPVNSSPEAIGSSHFLSESAVLAVYFLLLLKFQSESLGDCTAYYFQHDNSFHQLAPLVVELRQLDFHFVERRTDF